MSSVPGIPQETPHEEREEDEHEPLLGRSGDASQKDGNGIQFNFIIGTLPFSLRSCDSELTEMNRHCDISTDWNMDSSLPYP